MDNPLHLAAFNTLIDRGVSPDSINADTLQAEAEALATAWEKGADTAPEYAVDDWRLSKSLELFHHVEIMVERLRALVESDNFSDGNPEARETIRRLNLSARSIYHMSIPEDAAQLMAQYGGRGSA